LTESTTSISSAKERLSRHAGRRCAALRVMMTAESGAPAGKRVSLIIGRLRRTATGAILPPKGAGLFRRQARTRSADNAGQERDDHADDAPPACPVVLPRRHPAYLPRGHRHSTRAPRRKAALG